MKFRPALSTIETVAITAGIGLLLALAIGPIRSVLRLKTEYAIQENIQTVWISANEFFLENETQEVAVADLPIIATMTPIASEDYSKINNGKITATDHRLVLTFDDNGTSRTVTYTAQ